MCTVSYIPLKKGGIITSNRDEHVSRRAELSLKERVLNGHKVVFPQDSGAGGSWFAINERGSINVLLNGAFSNHKRTPPYAKSRGRIVLEVTAQRDTIAYLKLVSLKDIEPFTLIVCNLPELWEFRWDGHSKHFAQKESTTSHIWSSVTLYNSKAVAVREALFTKFIQATREVTSEKIIGFHHNNYGDSENGFIIDRNNGLKTLSITQAVLTTNKLTLEHNDLSSKKSVRVALDTIHSLAPTQ
ncbi:MAG: NRDE family protein [Bacteroidota bacterium]